PGDDERIGVVNGVGGDFLTALACCAARAQGGGLCSRGSAITRRPRGDVLPALPSLSGRGRAPRISRDSPRRGFAKPRVRQQAFVPREAGAPRPGLRSL